MNTTHTADKEDILSKIRKLRALTVERGATEEEAAEASRRMFALLAKYNLELSEVSDSAEKRDDQTVGEERFKRGNYVWETFLYQAVAHLNFCDYLRGYDRTHLVIGTKANSTATHEMASYLIDTILRLGTAAAKSIPAKERWDYKHAFHQGCERRLRERINQMAYEARAGLMKAADSDSLLPALADVYAVAKAGTDAYMKSHYPHLRHSSYRASVRSREGYRAGQAAGNSVSLNRQIGGSRRPSGYLN